MQNPNLMFEIGKAATRGRSVHGRVIPTDGGYEFKADLYRRLGPDFYTCNTVALKVDRPFDAFDFAFFAHMVSVESFETNSRDIGLRAGSRADVPALKAIYERFSVAPGPGEEPSKELVADIVCLEDQLEGVRKREAMQLALAASPHLNEAANPASGSIRLDDKVSQTANSRERPNVEAAFQRVPIAFCTVLVKREFLPSSSLRVPESERSTSSLAAYVFMNSQAAENFVDLLAAHGVVPGQHLGVADMIHGPVVDCVGIDYVCDEQRIPPSWTAFCVPPGSPD